MPTCCRLDLSKNEIVYSGQKEFTNEQAELAAIYYAVNEVMMNIYDILNEERSE